MTAAPQSPQRPDGATHCYVGRKKCGCWVAAAVDSPEHQADTFEALAEWAREGLIISRESLDEVRLKLMTCPHKDLGEAPAERLAEPEQDPNQGDMFAAPTQSEKEK